MAPAHPHRGPLRLLACLFALLALVAIAGPVGGASDAGQAGPGAGYPEPAAAGGASIDADESDAEAVHNATVRRAPGAGTYDHDDEFDAILADATHAERVARDDLVVLEVRASGVDDVNESTASLRDAGLTVSARGRPGPFHRYERIDVANLTDDEVALVPRPEDGALYVVLDAEQFWAAADGHSLWRGEATTLDDPSISIEDPQWFGFRLEAATAEFRGEFDHRDRLLLPVSEATEVTVGTNLAPGTELTVSLEHPDVVRTLPATVESDGNATATFDLSDLDHGTPIPQVRVETGDGTTRATSEALALEPDRPAHVVTATRAPSDPIRAGQNVTLAVGVENVGGAPGIASPSVHAGGELVSRASPELDSDEAWSAVVPLPADERGPLRWQVETQHDSVGGTVDVLANVSLGGDEPLPLRDTGLYYDVTGDGELTHRDLVAFHRYHGTAAVQDHLALFDATGDGRLQAADVRAAVDRAGAAGSGAGR